MLHVWKISISFVFLCAWVKIVTNAAKPRQRDTSPAEKQARLINSLVEYDVTFPVEVDHAGDFVDHVTKLSDHRRRRRSLNEENEPITYQLEFQNRTFKLRLRVNDKLFGSNFVVERFKEDGRVERTKAAEHCYLIGETEDSEFNVAITDCDGLAGMIDLGEDAIFIEPVLNETLAAERGWNKTGRPHLMYRSSSLHHDKREDAWPIDNSHEPIFHEETDMDFRHEAAAKAFVTFVNRANRLVKIYYKEGQQEKFFQTLSQGRETSVNTYVAHRWLARDRDTKKLLHIEGVTYYSPPAGSTYDNRKRAYVTIPRNLKLPRPIVILPPNAHVQFVNRIDRFIKLYYKEDDDEKRFFATVSPKGVYNVNTYAGHDWFAVDYDTGKPLHINGLYHFKPVKNSIVTRMRVYVSVPAGVKFPIKVYPDAVNTQARYIEVMATADASVVKYHGKENVQKYVLTLMNIVSRIYQHKSIGVPIYFVVVRLVLLEKDPKEVQISGHPMKSLNSICYWGHKMRTGSDTRTKNYHDQTVFLTRKDFGPSGYAPVHAMCYRSRSCTLNDDDGFTSSFIIAHETGHTLGMEHDGVNNNCSKDVIKGSIMASLVRSRFDRFYWSACSRRELIHSLSSLWCLKDIPFRNDLPHLIKLPGEIYTADQQCKKHFGSTSRFCTSVNRNLCKELWCTRGGSYSSLYCHTRRTPALEGTECAPEKWCRLGKCVSKSDNPAVKVPNPRPTEKSVHGGWSEWSAFTECSRSCGTGIKSKTRQCDNPEPAFGGKPCMGNTTSYELCNVQHCPGKLYTYHETRDEQCQRLAPREAGERGANWTLYDFDNTGVNCDFDSGLCGWMNDESDDFDWTRRSGSTPSSRTGPTTDHTHLNGKEGSYLFIETSRPALRGWRARLVSRVIVMRVSCLRLWYHMKGSDTHIGELALLIKPLGVNTNEKTIWSFDQTRGDMWILSVVTLYSMLPYQIIIQGTRGDGYLGDIAIDDVLLQPDSCRQHLRPTREQNRIQINPCITLCEPQGRAPTQSDALVLSLENGTSCHDNPSLFDSCVQGKCLQVGCDGIAGSPKLLDKCGVCDGGNDTCIPKTETLKISPKEDLQVMFSCPVGSTNIRVEKTNDVTHYLVPTATASEHAYINGDGVPLESGAYFIAGTKFTYTRVGTREVLESLGPTKERFELRLKKVQEAGEAMVKFQLYQNLSTSNMYFWKADPWYQCSKTCGDDGVQSRDFKCYRESDGELVALGLCETKQLPSNSTRPCNRDSCERNLWNTSDWSACSTSCGPGTQSRQLQCVKFSNGEPVDQTNCSDKRPEEKRECMLNPCYSWNTSYSWSSCSRGCGGGWQNRRVYCINMSTKRFVSSMFCGGQRPVTRRRCKEHSCYSWRASEFSRCSRTCGGGIQFRQIDCQSHKYPNKVQLVSSVYCSGKRPPRTQFCNVHPCFKWNTTEWSKCSTQCGPGTQTRTVKCIDLFHNLPIALSACGKKPDITRSCLDRRCNTWKTTNWTSCPVECGGGVQTRQVSCQKLSNGQILASSHCGPQIPARRRKCNTKPCYYWDITTWSNCSVPCGGGLQTRQADCKMNSTGENVYSGYCGGTRPSDTQRCNEAPCPAEWTAGNWSECSRTCGQSVRTRVVSCTSSMGKRSVFCDLKTRPRSSIFCDFKPCPTERPSIFDELSCTFEEGLCQWKNVQGELDHFDWLRWKGDTPSRKTGPKSDHTLRTPEGFYMYTEASKPQNRDDRARLVSPLIEAKLICLDFWYNMFGKSMGVLKVYLVESPGTRGRRLWFKNGERGQEWHNAKFAINSTEPYRLAFEGVRGRGFAGDMAIDDVKIYAGQCSEKPVAQDTSCKGDAWKYCDRAVRLRWCSSKRWKTTCCKSCASSVEGRAGS